MLLTKAGIKQLLYSLQVIEGKQREQSKRPKASLSASIIGRLTRIHTPPTKTEQAFPLHTNNPPAKSYSRTESQVKPAAESPTWVQLQPQNKLKGNRTMTQERVLLFAINITWSPLREHHLQHTFHHFTAFSPNPLIYHRTWQIFWESQLVLCSLWWKGVTQPFTTRKWDTSYPQSNAESRGGKTGTVGVTKDSKAKHRPLFFSKERWMPRSCWRI